MTSDRQRVVTWAPPTPAGLSGLAAVQALAAGGAPPPPVASLLGIVPAHVEAGLVRMALTPAEFHYNPIGSVHGGVAATVLEMAMAAAVRSTLPPGRDGVTVEIKVSYARAMTLAVGAVVAEGRVVQAGRQVALAEGRITDAAGRLYALASSTCLIEDATPAAAAAAPAAERRRVVAWADPVAAARAVAGKAGLDALHERGVDPPIAVLLGMVFDAVAPGQVQMSLPPGEHLFGQSGGVHGGMLATLLDTVLGCCIHTALPAGRGYTTLELKLALLRPVTAESGVVTATGQVLHTGSRIATSEARAVDASGRLCATATTTCLLFDARPSG